MINLEEFDKFDYLPETIEALKSLIGRSATELVCVHGDAGAIGLYETPEGCVVFPRVKAQFLCQQHRITDGFIGGLTPVAVQKAFAESIRDEPDFYLNIDEVGLAQIEERE